MTPEKGKSSPPGDNYSFSPARQNSLVWLPNSDPDNSPGYRFWTPSSIYYLPKLLGDSPFLVRFV